MPDLPAYQLGTLTHAEVTTDYDAALRQAERLELQARIRAVLAPREPAVQVTYADLHEAVSALRRDRPLMQAMALPDPPPPQAETPANGKVVPSPVEVPAR